PPRCTMAFTLSEIMAARRQQHQQQHGARAAVDVDEYSANPTQAFTFYNINQGRFQPPHVHMVDPLPHDAPKPPGYTRFVCVSDTHSRTDAIQMPYGDVFIHAGDFTELGLPSEVKKFNDWLEQHYFTGAGDARDGHGPSIRERASPGLAMVPWRVQLQTLKDRPHRGGREADLETKPPAALVLPEPSQQLVAFILSPCGTLPYEYKIVIAGNHELTFDQEFMADLIKQDFYYFPSASKLKPENYENVQSLLTNCIYLQDSEVSVRGFRVYGSPWQPWYYGWGFNLPRGQALLDKWNLIPDSTDVLITHCPPLGFLDWVPKKMQRVGCMELLNTVQRRVQPKLHVFGHIHEGYGVMTDGATTFVNGSACTVNFQPMNPPIVIDLPTPRST
ncbi:MPPD1 protein, partial [Atractosteus spatula]|nr:MPPD1 protein [Atractosteus spatula]